MKSIGFIGSGAMATAMAGGLFGGSIFSKFIFSDVDPAVLMGIQRKFAGSVTTRDNTRIRREADVIVLAIKPQFFEEACKGMLDTPPAKNQLIISLMAGITLAQLEKTFGTVPLVRTMPNTPLLVKRGSTGYAFNSEVKTDQKKLVTDIFSQLGIGIEVRENHLDAVTGLSGSGPAYVALLIEALADGGVLNGLPRPVAITLAQNTVFGTGALVTEKNLHPAVLKDLVSSPAGTTIHGIRALEEGRFRASVIAAVTASAKRSNALKSKM